MDGANKKNADSTKSVQRRDISTVLIFAESHATISRDQIKKDAYEASFAWISISKQSVVFFADDRLDNDERRETAFDETICTMATASTLRDIICTSRRLYSHRSAGCYQIGRRPSYMACKSDKASPIVTPLAPDKDEAVRLPLHYGLWGFVGEILEYH
jgi:hypothetical protein